VRFWKFITFNHAPHLH